MKIKQIIFTDVNKAELLEQERPEPGEYQVLVKRAYTTISCGTEKANITGDINVNASAVPTDTVALFPRKCGYSGSGIVEKVGSKVTKVKVGDRVVGVWGVHSDYDIYDENSVVLVDDGVSLQEASMGYISTFSAAAVRKTNIEFGESAIVMGLGILGIFAVQFLKAAGAVPIIAVDPVEERRNNALKFGADYALDPNDADFAEKVKGLTDGGVNAAIEVTGVGKALDQVLDCMAKHGRIALLGCTRNSDFTIDYYRKIHFPGITLVGAHTIARPQLESHHGYWTHPDELKGIFKLIKGKRVNFKDMIFEVHSPEEAPEVFYRLATDKNFPIVVQFDWSQLKD